MVGLLDPRGSETVVAAVTLGPGAGLDEAASREHCRAGLARHKAPRRIVAVEELPRAVLGKIQRRELREQLRRTGVLP